VGSNLHFSQISRNRGLTTKHEEPSRRGHFHANAFRPGAVSAKAGVRRVRSNLPEDRSQNPDSGFRGNDGACSSRTGVPPAHGRAPERPSRRRGRFSRRGTRRTTSPLPVFPPWSPGWFPNVSPPRQNRGRSGRLHPFRCGILNENANARHGPNPCAPRRPGRTPST